MHNFLNDKSEHNQLEYIREKINILQNPLFIFNRFYLHLLLFYYFLMSNLHMNLMTFSIYHLQIMILKSKLRKNGCYKTINRKLYSISIRQS